VHCTMSHEMKMGLSSVGGSDLRFSFLADIALSPHNGLLCAFWLCVQFPIANATLRR